MPARRAKGAETRDRILTATLEVIATLGVKGVTHRAVAKQAGVQLSLTTYYFKSLNEMIVAAFEKFAQKGRVEQEPLWREIDGFLEGLKQAHGGDLQTEAARVAIAAHLIDLTTEYLFEQVTSRRLGLAVEQAFFHESSLAAELCQSATEHHQRLLAPMIELCAVIDPDADATVDAEILLGTITGMEYRHLRMAPEQINRDRIRKLLSRQIAWWLRVPPSTEKPQ